MPFVRCAPAVVLYLNAFFAFLVLVSKERAVRAKKIERPNLCVFFWGDYTISAIVLGTASQSRKNNCATCAIAPEPLKFQVAHLWMLFARHALEVVLCQSVFL